MRHQQRIIASSPQSKRRRRRWSEVSKTNLCEESTTDREFKKEFKKFVRVDELQQRASFTPHSFVCSGLDGAVWLVWNCLTTCLCFLFFKIKLLYTTTSLDVDRHGNAHRNRTKVQVMEYIWLFNSVSTVCQTWGDQWTYWLLFTPRFLHLLSEMFIFVE